MAMKPVVRAAGGVVSRRDERGTVEVLLVHRDAHRDWSFPKGKLEPGETDQACALREVEEETGLTCALESELPSVSYHDKRGRPKVVRYWAMRPVAGRAAPHNEIDAVRWIDVDGAASLLTYPRDRELLAAFSASLAEATR